MILHNAAHISRLRNTYPLHPTSSRCSSAAGDVDFLKKLASRTAWDQLRAYPFLVITSESVTGIDMDAHPIFRKLASVY